MKRLLLFAVFLLPSITYASISITGTRVIYNESDRSVAVKINNRGDTVSIIQAWINDKMINQAPSEGASPFLLYPAVSKIISGGEQYLRIKKIENIPNNITESVYWLNIKDIPEAPKNKDENYLQLSIISKIKLFYRPAALKNNAGEMYKDLLWSVHNNNGNSYLTVKNNSKYYASFTEARIKNGGKQKPMALDMVAPGADQRWKLTGITLADINNNKVEYGMVNDFGAVGYRLITLK